MTKAQKLSPTISVENPTASCDFYIKHFDAKVKFDCGWYISIALGDCIFFKGDIPNFLSCFYQKIRVVSWFSSFFAKLNKTRVLLADYSSVLINCVICKCLMPFSPPSIILSIETTNFG